MVQRSNSAELRIICTAASEFRRTTNLLAWEANRRLAPTRQAARRITILQSPIPHSPPLPLTLTTAMKTNPVKKKLRAGQPSFGTWLSLGDLFATRVLARHGLRLAHARHGASAHRLVAGGHHFRRHRRRRLRAAGPRAGGKSLLHQARRSTPAPGALSRRWSTRSSRPEIIAAAKYPPVGNRSLGGGMHALNFDATAGDYFKHANDEILVVLQTESPHRRRQCRSDLQPARRRCHLRRPGRSARQHAQARRQRSHRRRIRSHARNA